MKKLYFLFFFLIIHSLQSQVINFPDANLKAKLLEADVSNPIANFTKIDVNENGEIEVEEAQNVYYLNISNSSISDLTGLNYFGLTILDCSYNEITNFEDVNQQYLEQLDCSHNQIQVLSIETNFLTDMNCSYNLIESLDLAHLGFTDFMNISNNNLSTFLAPDYIVYLDIRNNDFNGFSLPFFAMDAVLVFGGNPSDQLFYNNGSWRAPKELYYSSPTATSIDLSYVPIYTYELFSYQPNFYFIHCYSLESIMLNNNLVSNEGNGGIDILNCNNLSLICSDSGEVGYFNQRLVELGLNDQVLVSTECQLSNPNFEIQEVVLFPNPVQNTLNIKLPNSNTINEISIYNIIGQLVLKSTNTSSIDVSSLISGTYLIKVHSEDQIFTEKFIKQ